MPDDISMVSPPADCPLCKGPSRMLYSALQDRLYTTCGTWPLRQCITPSCGILWLAASPDDTAMLTAYDDYHTHQPHGENRKPGIYARLESEYFSRRFGYPAPDSSLAERIASRLLTSFECRRCDFDVRAMYLPYSPGSRLLDVGAGNGDFLGRMNAMGWRGEGVETDDRAASAARMHGLPVRTGTLMSAAYPDAWFDAITLSHVIEHVGQPAQLLAECRRILAPGGVTVIVTPNASSWAHWLYGCDWRGLEPPRHLHLFTRNALRRLANDAGLEVRTCRSVARARFMFIESRALNRRSPINRSQHPSFLIKRWADLMEVIEWMLTLTGADMGEELHLIATKPTVAT